MTETDSSVGMLDFHFAQGWITQIPEVTEYYNPGNTRGFDGNYCLVLPLALVLGGV
jgi:hypothetical protein